METSHLTQNDEAKETMRAFYLPAEKRFAKYYTPVFTEWLYGFKDGQKNHGRYNSKKLVGALMDGTAQCAAYYGKEDFTTLEWERFYFANITTPARFLQTMRIIQNDYPSFSDEQAFAYLMLHTIDNAFKGHKGELDVKNLIKVWAKTENSSWDVRNVSIELDFEYGIDLEIFDTVTGEVVRGIQVKQDSYWTSSYGSTIEQRTVTFPTKYVKYSKEFGAPVFEVPITSSLKANKPVFRAPDFSKVS